MDSRPTAVDLSNAITLLKTVTSAVAASGNDAAAVRSAYVEAAEKILEDDYTTNLAIGRYGAEYLRRQQLPVQSQVDPEEQMRYFTTSPPGTQGAPDQSYKKLSVLTHCNTGYVTWTLSHHCVPHPDSARGEPH